MAKTPDDESFRNRVQNSKKPKFWIPKNEEDFIVGEVVAFRTMVSKFGDGEVMVLKDDEDNELYSVFISSVIKTARERENIQVGERVGIKYLGMVEGETADYKDFIVMVDRPGKEEGKE